jgi:hypothetical protein
MKRARRHGYNPAEGLPAEGLPAEGLLPADGTKLPVEPTKNLGMFSLGQHTDRKDDLPASARYAKLARAVKSRAG